MRKSYQWSPFNDRNVSGDKKNIFSKMSAVRTGVYAVYAYENAMRQCCRSQWPLSDSSPWKMFLKKIISTFRGYFFPAFTETTKIFCTIRVDYQCQASSQRKEKLNRTTGLGTVWYNLVGQIIFGTIFTGVFLAYGKVSIGLGTDD